MSTYLVINRCITEMAPDTSLHRCTVCGRFTTDKQEKPLIERDDLWKQHADEIRTRSEVPVKEFLKYFQVSLKSFVEAEDVDQVLEELKVCSDCNDWVLFGAFLKEKYLRVDRILREKVRHAFVSGRIDSKVSSPTGVVLEKILQCLTPCSVRVNKIVAPDLGHVSVNAKELGDNSGLRPPPSKRFKATSPIHDHQGSTEAVPDDTSTVNNPIDYEENEMNNGADDTPMAYDDYFDIVEALAVVMGGDAVDNRQHSDAVAATDSKEISSKSKTNRKKIGPKSMTRKRKPRPKSKSCIQEKLLSTSDNPQERKRKSSKVIVFRKCPVCEVGVDDYIEHMIKKHHVQPHRFLLNNFWCRGCKIAYQPPDPQTPTGQYLHQHHDDFLEFIKIHSERACPVSVHVEPHPCRFCGFVSHHQASPAIILMDHEAKFHADRFGADYPMAADVINWRSSEAKQKYIAKKQREQSQQITSSDSRINPVSKKAKAVVAKSAKSKRKKKVKKKCDPNPQALPKMLKNEVHRASEGSIEDGMVKDDPMDNFEDVDRNSTVAKNESQDSVNETPPETPQSQHLSEPDKLGLELDASGIRRSMRPRKPIQKASDSRTNSPENGREESNGSKSDDESAEIVDPGSPEFEENESEPDSERDDEDSEVRIRGKKVSKAKQSGKVKKTSTKKLPVVSDDDDEEPNDGSEKLPCVLCDAQRSQAKLSKHYRVKHNLISPQEGYFACKGCQHAFLSPNENIPTGKFVKEDIEYLREFISDHHCCEQLYVNNASDKYQLSPLHFCRYCFRKYCSRSSLKDVIKHETESHENANSETTSLAEAPSVFVYYCVYCKFKTELLEDVYKHMRTHRKQHRFGCCRCDAQFKDVRELIYHIRLHGTSSDVFEACLLCDTYLDAPSIVGHYRQSHGLEMVNYKYFGCWHCEEAFISESPEHPSGTVFRDDLECLKQFSLKHEHCQLIRQHAQKEQKCQKCPSVFTTMRQLVEHEELKHVPSDQRYVTDRSCGTCRRSFSTEEGLQKHKVLHLPEEYGFKGTVPFHDCPDCFHSFGSHNKIRFDRHRLLMHNPDKEVKDRNFSQMARTQFLKNRTPHFTESQIAEVCYICGAKKGPNVVIMKHHLRDHKMGIVSNQMYCLACKEPFVSETDGAPYHMNNPTEETIQKFKEFAEKHVKCPVGPEKPIQCVRCQKHETKVQSYLHHFARHRSDGLSTTFPNLDCLRCGETFNSILQLREHLKSSNDKPPAPHLTFRTGGLNCLSCVKCFDTPTEFTLHFKYFHNNVDKQVKFECSVCHKVLESEIKTGNEIFPETCVDHETTCKAKARKNCKACQEFSWPDLTCFLCQETFDSIQRYSAHINEHFGHLAESVCPICPAVFAELEELNEHVKLHGLQTFKQYPGFYACHSKRCLWVSNRPEAESGRLVPEDLSEFQVFAENHENCARPRVDNFSCRFCDYQCSQQFFFFVHEFSHTRRFQAFCEECGRGFSSQLRLRDHAKRHQEKLHLTCNLCPRKFKHRTWLEQHMNAHAGIKPFVCDKCGKGFSMAKRLQEHVQGVHNKPTEKTSPCTWGCDRMFATRRDARVHEKQAHNRPRETRIRNQHRDFGE